MPKLDGTHLTERLKKRIAELQAGEEVAARDINVLLNKEQQQALKTALAEQENLRNAKRPKTDEEKKELGWKTKKEIRLEIFKAALIEAYDGEEAAWDKKLRDAEVRAARIYMDGYIQATSEGKDIQAAKDFANNQLTRAGLRRQDRETVGFETKRDREVREMERQIMQKAEDELDDYEREQLELLRDYEKAIAKNKKTRGW